ncbi:hypothetical protein PFLUV_G00105320 [Perca fluviatilis]|uniref:STIL N-terminal domain-containing protein n=1 Tax=Perca fluviatilis TaxID=8168 RepID=A0A6A5F4M6_PERFL|nr:hypothetical protein PFLUV_G00105320 [Perca fluviatilis]
MSCPVNLQDLPSGVFETVFTPENVRVRTMNSLTPLSFPKTRSALWDGSPAGDKLRLQLGTHRKPRLVLLEKALRLAQRHARHSNKPRLLCFLLGSLCVDAETVPSSDAVVQSEAELHHCFKVLQQCVSGRQSLDLSQLLRVRGRVVCCQQSDSAAFSLSWAAVCPSVSVEVQPVRAVPVIPTALLRSLTGATRPPLHANRQRGFLTMDQTRKLLLLLESDPKALQPPLVGLVLSESGCFLLVLFGSTHRAPQFFQCRGSASGPQLDYRLLTASQCVTLYQQAVSVEGQTLRCELGSEDHSRQTEVFREAQTSFNRAAPPAAGLSVSDQDSGVEMKNLSPPPVPEPPPPRSAGQSQVLQRCRLNHNSWQEAARPRPAAAADRKSAPPTVNRPAAPPHLHSTPYSNLQPPCSCCSAQTYECTSIFSSPGLRPAHPHPHHNTQRDRQLRLLQEQVFVCEVVMVRLQVQMLLEAQRKLQSSSGQQVDTQTPKSTASIAVGTGASLFWGSPVQFPLPHQEEQAPRPSSQADLSVNGPGGGAENSDITAQEAACSPSAQHSVSGLQSPVLGESVSMYRPADDQQSFFNNLMTQVTSRLQESESKQEVEEEEEEEESRRRSLSVVSAQSSRRRRSCGGDSVLSATVRQLQQLGVNVEEDLSEADRRNQQTIESSSTLAGINPAAVLSRLSVSESSASSLFPGASVDLSLEANAIALRYLSDSQLSRLSLGGHAPQTVPASASSSNHSLLSPSNMSLATRKYMRRYGLIEEEDGEEEEEEVVRQPFLPQSQLIRDLQPKMPLYPGGNKANGANKENRSNRHPASVRTGSRQTEGSVGNILDLSRLRQLPKLF